MKNFLKNLDKVENTILIILLCIQVVIVFVATFGRYTTWYRLTWAEELSRYSMVWMVFLGAIIATKTGGHFAVTAFDNVMPKPLYRIFLIARMVCVVAFCFFTTYYGYQLVLRQMKLHQVSPSLSLPMWLMYLAMPIGLVFMAIRYVMHTIDIMKGIGKDEEVQL